MAWTTQITDHLEGPDVHLMNAVMSGPDGRVAARGNVTSFMMPWGDILRYVQQSAGGSKHQEEPKGRTKGRMGGGKRQK